MLTAILVGGKVASGITAELGSMKVTEQIDALRALGVNYVKRLIVPRILAALIVFPLVTVLADVVGSWRYAGGRVRPRRRPVPLLEHHRLLGGDPRLSHRPRQEPGLRALVTLIGCYNGLVTEGGTEGLGRSTTATVVQVAMAVIISDFFLTKLLLILFW